MLRQPTSLLISALPVFVILLLSGCASRATLARRIAGKMLDPATSPKKSLLCRQRLIALAPDSDELLANAFFPIGLYDVPESALQQIAAAGFNLVVNGGKDAPYLNRAEAAGLRVIPYIRLSKMAEDIARVGRAGALFAWYLLDEPDLNRMPPEEYSRLARQLRKLDQARPIYLTVSSPGRYDDFMAECDIFAPNPYPIRHLDPEKNDLRYVAAVLDFARETAGTRPVWAIIQAFWAEPWWMRNPTPQELRAMVFMALNHGADGIIYFSYKSGDHPLTEHAELFEAIRHINGQLRALRGALLAKPVENAVRMTPLVKNDEIPEPGPMDYSLRRFGQAELLIAVNPDPRHREVRIVFPEEDRARAWVELFTEGELPPKLLFRDQDTFTFDPHQVRLFWIEPIGQKH